ncbi:hypothetical protein GN958_ATG11102, partial [Phytophthora infestans]
HRARVPLSTTPEKPEQHRLPLVVQGVVKATVRMRDAPGKMLDANGRIIPTSKSEELWSRWVASLRGDTATLMIYTYGLSISNARILEDFKVTCIIPEHTDRSRAATEASILELVERLREIWGGTFQASAAAWRIQQADTLSLRDVWIALTNQKDALEVRKMTLQGIRANIPLRPISAVIGRLVSMENMEEIEHQE